MKFELQMFIFLIALGAFVRKIDWRGHFFLFLFMAVWVYYNWKKG